MQAFIFVAIGGALGASLRYAVSLLVPGASSGFPWNTFLVNVLGCLVMGALFVLVVERGAAQFTSMNVLRPLLMVGFLGALTTFSTFGLDALLLFEQSKHITALIYVVFSTVFCIFATLLSVQFFRWLF